MQTFDPKLYPNLVALDDKVRRMLLTNEAKKWDTPTLEYKISEIHPVYWMETYGKVRPASMELGEGAVVHEGGVVPFVLNTLQLQLADKICAHFVGSVFTRVQEVILKHRKVGVSTLIAAFDYWHMRFVFNMNAFVIADISGHTDNIIEMVRTFHQYDTCGEGASELKHRPLTTKPMPKNKKGMRLSNYSMLEQDTGENSNPGTSGTVNVAHMSESAKWRDPENAETSLLNSIPRTGYAFVVKESTAFGVNKFAQDCADAELGKSAWEFVFLSWLDMPDCEDPVLEGEITPTEEERELMALYPKMTLGHVKFRRRQIEFLGSEQKFRQDFPLNSREPFLVSGSNYFNVIQVQQRIDELKFYIDWKKYGLNALSSKYPDILIRYKTSRYGLEESLHRLENRCAIPTVVQLNDNKGEVTYIRVPEGVPGDNVCVMYKKPERGRRYLVSVDVAEGKDQDNSVIEVFDCWAKEQVCELAGNYDEEYTAYYSVVLARLYNQAMIVPEMNNKCGGLLWGYLERSGYGKFFQRTYVAGNKKKKEPGWHTGPSVKGEVLGRLRIDFKNSDCLLYSLGLLDEMLHYMDIQGKLGAANNHKDDRVTSTAVNLQVITITPSLGSVGYKNRNSSDDTLVDTYGRRGFNTGGDKDERLRRYL